MSRWRGTAVLQAPLLATSRSEWLTGLRGAERLAAALDLPAAAPEIRGDHRDPLRFRTLWRSRMVRPGRPDKLLRTLAMLHRWGLTPAGAYGVAAIGHPGRPAIIDERGALTFGEVQRRTNALAKAFSVAGVGEEDTVAIMSRNHRGFIEATVACSKLGADVLCLDTELGAPSVADVLRRDRPAALVYDEEFSALIPRTRGRCKRFIAWCDEDARPSEELLEELIARGESTEPMPPRNRRGIATLTAGGTGSARHSELKVPCSLVLPRALLSPMPLRRGETTIVAAPMCHPWGLVHLKLGLRLGSTLVLRRRFDPQETLREVAEHHATALAVLPDMLQRIMGLGGAEIAQQETTSLRLIAINGSSLPEKLAMPAMASFGDVLYNLHGPSVVKLEGHWLGVDRSSVVASCDGRRSSLTAVRHAHQPRRQDLRCRLDL
jgi:non-ribosomal peptide synthetase component E (peptide arylation enzyme)